LKPFAPARDLLAEAASKGNASLIRSLLETQNTDGHTALHLACRRGSAELVEAIVAYQENVDILDKDEGPPIVFALAAGSPQCVRALIRRSSNVNSTLREGLGPSLAHICAHHGQPECMEVRHHVHLLRFQIACSYFYNFSVCYAGIAHGRS
jgi:E3 ubiquitin-protein ligase KEG